MKINLEKINGIIIIIYLTISIFMGNYFYKIPTITKDIIFCFLILNMTVILLKKRKIKKSLIVISILIILFITQSLFYKSPDIFAIRYYIFPYIIFYCIVLYTSKFEIKMLKKFLTFYYWLICGVIIIQILQNWNKVFELLKNFSLENLKIMRFYSFFSLPTLAGGALVILGCFLIIEKRSMAYYINTFLFLVLTYSRGSILAFIIFTVGYIYYFYRKVFINIIIPILICLIIFILNLDFKIKDESFLDRIGIIKNLHFKNILFGNGAGFSNGRDIVGKKIFDNEYIRLIYEIGLFGIFIYFNFFYRLWRKVNQELKLLLLVYFTLMLTMEILTIYPIPIFIYLILGIFYIERTKL